MYKINILPAKYKAKLILHERVSIYECKKINILTINRFKDEEAHRQFLL